MTTKQYKSRLATALWEMYLENKEEIGKLGGISGIIITSLLPELPNYLAAIDNDEKMQEDILRFLEAFNKRLEEAPSGKEETL